MWDAAMAGNRIIKLGKQTDFQCRQMEHQLGAYTDCNHGAVLAVLKPSYCRHIYRDGSAKFRRFAVEVWGICPDGKTDGEIARAGIDAQESFIREIGLPATLRELGADADTDLKEIADSCAVVSGGYKKLTGEEILEIFKECF